MEFLIEFLLVLIIRTGLISTGSILPLVWRLIKLRAIEIVIVIRLLFYEWIVGKFIESILGYFYLLKHKII